MADTEEGKGKDSTLGDSKVDTPVDHARDFQDEKMRMTAAKSTMTRKIERLETALTDFKGLDKLDSTNLENLYGIASEVNEIRNDVKEAYTKIGAVNEVLGKKLLKLKYLMSKKLWMICPMH